MFATTKTNLCENVSKKIAEKIMNSKNIVVLTGAGISAESGIPTFRGAGGLWRNFSAPDLATPEAFDENPALVWQFYQYRRNVVEQCKPNAGHYALAKIADIVKKHNANFTILTQNIDRLHHAAGSDASSIVELHGSLWLVKPVGHEGFLEEPGKVWEDRTQPICPALNAEVCTNTNISFEKVAVPVEDLPHYTPPLATSSSSSARSEGQKQKPLLLRPAVVWFGESLDVRTMRVASAALQKADLLLIIGTSGVVYPAAGFGDIVRRGGGAVVHFNLEENTAGIDQGTDMGVFGPSGESLPAIVKELEAMM